jgi:Holliday junction resolvase RusA-like endonuclease
MRFEITGEIKPYVRMTRRGKWGSPQAQEYLASKAAIGLQFKAQMRGREMSVKTPLCVAILFTVQERQHCKDLDNLIKAILDAGNGIAWGDDRWIDEIHALRRKGTWNRVSVEVKELGASQGEKGIGRHGNVPTRSQGVYASH